MNDRAFRDAFDRCPVPMWLVRAADGAVLKANDAALGLGGSDPGSAPRSREELPPSASFTPLGDGEEAVLLAVLVDTSGREAVEARRQGENLYRTLIEQLPDHVWNKDREGRYVSCNRRYARSVGLDPGTIAGHRDEDFYPPERAARYREADEKVMASGRPLEDEERLIVGGTEAWFHTTKVPLADADGRCVGTIGIERDVTERKRAEEALRASEERWRSIVENEPECVKVLDRDGCLLEMNQATLEQVLGKRASGLAAPEDRAAFDEMVAAVFRGETRTLVFDMIGLKGRRLTLETKSVPWWETPEKASVRALLGVTRDVTERRRAEEALRESERALREAQAVGRMGSYVYDIGADAWTSSEVLDDIFGIGPDHVRDAEGWLALVHPSQRAEMEDYLRRLVAERGTFDRDYLIVRRSDGTERWVHGRGVLELAGDGSPRLLRGTIQDVTLRKRYEERLKRAAAVFSSSREGFVITNADAEVEEINEAFTAITGYGRDEVVGKNLRILQSGRHPAAFYREMWARLTGSGQWQGEVWNRRKDGGVYPQWLSVSVIRGERSRVAGYVGVFTDISALKATEEKLEHLARHDPLTDLPNRLLLASYLGHAVARSQRSGRSGAVLFLDLDRFKNVNDSLGHAAGDELLRATARTLRERLRGGDLIARLGGDEFVVLLEDVEAPEAAGAVASQLIDQLKRPFVLEGGREVSVGLSVGISMFPGDGDRTEVLIQHADAALYAAKEAGRGTFRFYSEALTVAANERLALEVDLRRGIALDQFVLHYQPEVRLADGRVEGVEALLRRRSPERGLVPPATFLGVAEDTGLVVPIGALSLRRGCRQMMEWLGAGVPVGKLAVNLSPRQLLQPDLQARVEAVLEETGLDPRHLELEVTEGAIMEQGAAAESRLAALKRLGVRVAIDDFGTGYSSLSHLRRFPIDTLKIDRSFVASVADDRTQREIVVTIVSLARQLGLHVVAEGVEDAQQAAFLAESGCDSAQGYFFGRPVPAEEIAPLVAAFPAPTPSRS